MCQFFLNNPVYVCMCNIVVRFEFIITSAAIAAASSFITSEREARSEFFRG